MYVCVPLLVCACEVGQYEDARLVGCMLIPRDLGTVGDRVGPRAHSEFTGFQGSFQKITHASC